MEYFCLLLVTAEEAGIEALEEKRLGPRDLVWPAQGRLPMVFLGRFSSPNAVVLPSCPAFLLSCIRIIWATGALPGSCGLEGVT